jgi:hippurate hydrolase
MVQVGGAAKNLLGVIMIAMSTMGGDVVADDTGPNDRQLARLLETYRHLHAHPELSFDERETAAFVADRLTELGFDVTTGVGRYRDTDKTCHGVVALLHNGDGPTVMVRTDLDALPIVEETGLEYASQVTVEDSLGRDVGVMHACGHDAHMTVFLGTAEQLAARRDAWSGTLLMIGQPAEERGAGARAMLDDGLYERFDRPDAALALHVGHFLKAGTVGVIPGYAFASVDSVDITVHGVGGHGALPHTTTDPVVVASRIVLALQTIVSREVSPIEPAVITVGSIHGGTKHNIIPEEVRMQLTVRAYDPAVRRQLLDGIARVCRGVALSAGVPTHLAPEVVVHEEEATPAMYNDPEMTERLASVFADTLGADNVVRVDPLTAGEDFSRYTLDDRSVPSMIFWLGTVDPEIMARYLADGTPLTPIHSSRYAPLAGPTIRTGVRAMTAAAIALLSTDQ